LIDSKTRMLDCGFFIDTGAIKTHFVLLMAAAPCDCFCFYSHLLLCMFYVLMYMTLM